MLLGKTRIGHSNTHREEVESDLPVSIVDHRRPAFFVAMGMVDNKEETIGSGKWRVESGEWKVRVGETIILFEAPQHIGSRASVTRTTRSQHLGVQPVDKGRMQTELRLGA